MNLDAVSERLFESLVEGDRDGARQLVTKTLTSGNDPRDLYADVYWPVYERIEKLHRADQMSVLTHHFATRLLRVLVDQTAGRFAQASVRKRTVLAVCGPTDPDELAAQMSVDLLEADGYQVRFAGGGIANDEILGEIQSTHPHVLVFFASAASDLPAIRRLIDTVQEIGACRDLQIVVGGGVFNRADDLAEEIGSDLWACSPSDLVEEMNALPERRATEDQRTVGKNKHTRHAA